MHAVFQLLNTGETVIWELAAVQTDKQQGGLVITNTAKQKAIATMTQQSAQRHIKRIADTDIDLIDLRTYPVAYLEEEGDFDG